MHKTKNTLLIAETLTKYLQGTCSTNEKSVVDSWLKTPSNRNFFNEFKNKSAENIIKNQNFDLSKARIALQREFKIKRRFTNRKRMWLAAASIIILLGLSFILFFSNVDKIQSKENYIAQFKIYNPGNSKAILSTSEGEKIILKKDAPVKMLIEKDGTTLQIKGESLSYKKRPGNSNIIAYNTIEVPRNGEFSILLSDGTIVWLNSESKLTYPVTFSGNTRKVYLEGEAYFEVAKDENKKFIVTTEKSILEVKGTTFNMKAYKGEVNITTLVEGSVNLRHRYDEASTVNLKPNDQAKISTVNRKIKVDQVETHYYTAWKDGFFAYKEASLEEILKQLARWYDFEYNFKDNDIKNKVFTARLKRYDGVGEIFNILEQTGKVKFIAENNKVIVISV
jgi:hypothetical protein